MNLQANFSFFLYVLEETTLAMLKKHLFLILGILLAISCHKGSDSPTKPQFSQRIKKVIRHVTYPNTAESIYPTEYFYDAQGRLDSLLGQKIFYAANGYIEKVVHPDLGGLSTYQYNNQGKVASILTKTLGTNNEIVFQYQEFFEYNDDGFVVKYWASNINDKTIITRENGNATKIQRVYNDTGQEHYVNIASYDDKPNPEYLAGLNNIYPNAGGPNNVTFGQTLSSDVSGSDLSPVNYTITYNDEGLPVKSVADSGLLWIEYIYE